MMLCFDKGIYNKINVFIWLGGKYIFCSNSVFAWELSSFCKYIYNLGGYTGYFWYISDQNTHEDWSELDLVKLHFESVCAFPSTYIHMDF